MGLVYEAYDKDLDRRVALKLLLLSPNANAEEAALDESAPHREDEREGEIRGGRVQDSRRVRDRDPARGAGRHVDPVVADAEVRDEPERGEVVERDGLVRDDDGLDFGTGL